MKHAYKQWLNASVLALLLGFNTDVMAQAVIFPQAQQPGIAEVFKDGNTYEIGNELLSARFTQQDGKLVFDGCEALNLMPNKDLFKIKLGNGTTATSSEMTLGEVRMVDLTGDADAAKGSLRFDGKAIEADYTWNDLKMTWKAILRNGSHYIRTYLDLKATKDVAMSEITPMMYTVDNVAAGSAPVVVGNTRGAMVASNKIFAGLETPMGLNTATSSTDVTNFTYNKWNEGSFIWTPGEDIPKGVLKLGFSTTEIVGSRGYLKFYEGGKATFTFKYESGAHRLNVVGVDVVDLKGKVISSDYHKGFTGNEHSKNTFTVDIPQKGSYLIRYFVETKTESIASKGNVTLNKKVAQPVIVFDLPAGKNGKSNNTSTSAGKHSRALSGNKIGENETLTDNWTPSSWKNLEKVPLRINELGFYHPNVKYIEQPLTIDSETGTFSVEFLYKSGNHRLNLCGVDLIDKDGNAVAYDYHIGYTGGNKEGNVYTMNIPYGGEFKLRYYAENKTESIDASGDIKLKLAVIDTVHLAAPATTPISGMWRRNTTLASGKNWEVSAVVGLIAPGQKRRSVAAYVERERAVPWRAYPIYNSWYELNINRNNDRNYTKNMHDYQCIEIVKEWEEQLYKPYNTGIQCFVWDDGWDTYGTWQFNDNFPRGFAEQDSLAREMGSGTGAWLGPVGGYGESGNYRREYWANQGGMQLSNPKYYEVFYKGCTDLMKKYDFRFFKFDGISAQFSSVGPDAGTKGEENAEGIIYAELDMRKVQPDIFFNTSVGTWASPFWFRITDAVWRQENDYGEIGNNNNSRERWITYRDRLVYQNFVKNSPLCPINCLMTHGFILSNFGPVSKDRNYDNIVREMRCAFACGSGMVELYSDYKLMNSIKDNNGKAGALWKDLAECINWQKKNADVLPDIHWVGGNPWTGGKHEVYGWASWNGKKATLALRNGANQAQTYTTTLRKALDIPEYVKTSITLSNSFSQKAVEGLPVGEAIDIDKELTIKLPGSTAFFFDGVDENPSTAIEEVITDQNKKKDNTVYDISGRRLSQPMKGINIIGHKKVFVK